MKPIPHEDSRKPNEVRIGFGNMFIYAQFLKMVRMPGKLLQ